MIYFHFLELHYRQNIALSRVVGVRYELRVSSIKFEFATRGPGYSNSFIRRGLTEKETPFIFLILTNGTP